MISPIRQFIQATPTPMAGLALGIASLGWCWENLGLNLPTQQSGAAAAAVLLLLVAVKFVCFPKVLFEELKHPVVGSVIPTFSMALMVITVALYKAHPALAANLWLLAVVMHVSFLASFFYHRARDFKLHHMLPSWFVPPVGLAVATLTNRAPEYAELAQAILMFAMAAYFVLMPLMLYRLVFSAPIPDSSKPTVAILAAPSSLCLAAYLQIQANPSVLLVVLLAGVAVLMTAVIYMGFFKLLNLPFSPGYSAFTFPMVISSTALFKTAQMMDANVLTQQLADNINQGARIELAIATLIVGYVATRYAMHYQQRIANARSL